MNAPARLLDAADCMDQAREEIIEKLLDGKQVEHLTFAGILDAELDSQGRAIAGECAGHLLAAIDMGLGEHQRLENLCALQKWMRSLVERAVDSRPVIIEQRAAEIAATEEPEHEPTEENA